MNVAFFVGDGSERVINSMKNQADNVTFFTYQGISDMIRESTMRHIFFDRIVFYDKIMQSPKEDLESLNSYVSEYSDNTQIVMICHKGSENTQLFANIFDSPLYTPVIVDNLTIRDMVNFVKGDILSLKASYYTLDVKKSNAVVGSYAKEGTEKTQSSVNDAYQKMLEETKGKKTKKGLFGGLFGGKKNKGQKDGSENPVNDTVSAVGEALQNGTPNPTEMGVIGSVGAASEVVKNTGFQAVNNFGQNYGNAVKESMPSSDHNQTNGVEFQGISNDVVNFGGGDGFQDDFDLSVGELGSQHADTGFLDEDGEAELEAEMNRQGQGYEEEEEEDEVAPVYEEDEEESEEDYQEQEEYYYEEEASEDEEIDEVDSQIRVITGLKGSGVTTYVIDSAVRLTDKGKKVLIIDLDVEDSGVLSFIDVESFYSRRCDNGINKGKVYSEDGVDIMSNGYGVDLNTESLLKVLSIRDRYDMIIIDCPLENIGVLPIDAVLDGAVMIRLSGRKQVMLRVLDKLTSRESLSPELEDALFERCKFYIMDKPDTFEEDVEYIRDFCFFGRGYWAEKLV